MCIIYMVNRACDCKHGVNCRYQAHIGKDYWIDARQRHGYLMKAHPIVWGAGNTIASNVRLCVYWQRDHRGESPRNCPDLQEVHPREGETLGVCKYCKDGACELIELPTDEPEENGETPAPSPEQTE